MDDAKKAKYRLYDYYDGVKQKVGEYSNLNTVKAACRYYEKNVVDGSDEWFPLLYRLEADGKYHRFIEWTY